MFAATAFATPASAANGTASGSCGPAAGDYGDTAVADSDFPGGGTTTPALYYQVNYSGVSAPTTIGVLRYYNGDLGSSPAVTSFTAQDAGGTFTGSALANINPDAQGGGVGEMRGQANHTKSFRGGGATGGGNVGVRDTDSTRANRRTGQFTSPQIGGGLEPGNYVFYIYTGSIQNVTRDPKDQYGPQPTFVVDQQGYLGMFSCAVVDNE